ncbi:MAG: nuclear transport factor 2 family protein [Epsilonproteobacteria bacterium]|nr:nuclear transport factor 2 family protein [Campylobacterota bacterium]
MEANKCIELACSYYTAMHNKDLQAVATCLHDNVELISPMAKINGKEAVLKAVEGYFPIFTSITVKEKFGSQNQVMLAYNLDCPEPIGSLRTAVLITITDDLISHIELFFDASPFKG